MAGMEHFEIHSKSYLVRWIEVVAGHTISWSLQPQKKSISFGIFKHPGGASHLGLTPNVPTNTEPFSSPRPDSEQSKTRHGSNTATQAPTISTSKGKFPSVIEKLESLGIKSVAWTGKCEADHVSMGHYSVPEGEGGMYGLVFDNTHSKQFSKTVTFVLMTFPTGTPPKSGHHMYLKQSTARGSSTDVSRASPNLLPVSDSHEDLPEIKPVTSEPRSRHARATEWDLFDGPKFYTGVLSKKRRKRNQGWARRFFSLDFTTSTLSYYKSRNASALRGAIPLSLAAIGADEKLRHISIDSGVEIWILRAQNSQAFEEWKLALQTAASQIKTPAIEEQISNSNTTGLNPVDGRDWAKLESIKRQISGITDSVRRLAKDTGSKPQTPSSGLGISDANGNLSVSPSTSETEGGDYFQGPSSVPTEKPAFWKRKPSNSNQNSGTIFRRNVSAQKMVSSSLAVASPGHASLNVAKRQASPNRQTSLSNEEIRERCTGVLRDLDSVLASFSSMLSQNREKRNSERPAPTNRASMDTMFTQEYFDAEDGSNRRRSQILQISGDSDAEESPERDAVSIGEDSDSDSEMDEAEARISYSIHQDQESAMPKRPSKLTPLPKKPIQRRSLITPSSGPPPSLISFLRKNVGKDLSTIAMPITSNEPLSLLQRQAEQMEYSELLDSAISASSESGERILYITAFALSSLSNSRHKERAIRKPFNPMLGETFELVREDKGFRFLAEKISHRPVKVACQAEANDWTFTHAPSPSQKFWGKSAELITEGNARVFLHSTGDCYSWSPPTCFLRNIIAGEKYVEPVQTMTVVDEKAGQKAVATFKSGGMFSGRSEEVTVQVSDARGNILPLGLQGRWTTNLMLTSSSHGHSTGAGTEIWRAGPLIQDAQKRYGMTLFSATLNEITSIEEDGKALPPTDSRKRPDQRSYEEGKIDPAEKMKVQLEEAQRRRRKEMETSGESWEPRWFERVDAGVGSEDEIWRLKGEEKGEDYWGVREAVLGFKRGKWDGVREVFELT